MKFFALLFYILLNCMCGISRCAEVRHDFESAQFLNVYSGNLFNEYLRQFGSCEALEFDDVIESYCSCQIDPFYLDVGEDLGAQPAKAYKVLENHIFYSEHIASKQSGKYDINIWLRSLASILQKSTADLRDSLQQIGTGLYDSIGNKECENFPNEVDLKVKARKWGCYLRQGAEEVKQAAAPLAASFASTVADATKGLANSVLRNQCDRPPRSEANDVLVRFQNMGCNLRKGLEVTVKTGKSWTDELWSSTKGFRHSWKAKIQEHRFYTYFYGEKKQPTWYEKLTEPVKNVWNNFREKGVDFAEMFFTKVAKIFS